MASSRRNNKNEKVLPSGLGLEQQSFEFEYKFNDNVLPNSSWSQWWKTIVLPLLQRCLCRLLTGRRRRTTTTTHQRLQHQRQSSLAIVVLRRIFFVLCFLSLFFTISYHLDQRIENDYHHTNQIAMTEQYNRQQQQQQQQQENDGQQSTMKSISVSLDDNKPSNSYRNNNNNSSNNSNNDGSKMDRKNHRHRRSSTTPSTMTMEKNVLSHYLTNSSNTTTNVNLTLQEASKGREHVLSILKDAGIDTYDPMDVLRLPMWSSVTELYYPNNNSSNRNSSATSMDGGGGGAAVAATTAGRSGKKDGNDYDNSEPRSGPIIIGLDTCGEFRQRVKYSDRFLGIAGNFNSGTTAFAITLQNNCRFLNNKNSSSGDGGEDSDYHSTTTNNSKDNVISITKDIKSVNRILNQVPWRKHKMSQYRDLYIKKSNNHPTTENTIVEGENVLPIVLIRGEFELELELELESSQVSVIPKPSFGF
jgi:hypothetical protein